MKVFFLLFLTSSFFFSCQDKKDNSQHSPNILPDKNVSQIKAEQEVITPDTTIYEIDSIEVIDSSITFFCKSHLLKIKDTDSAARKIEITTTTYSPHTFFNASQISGMPDTIRIDSFYNRLYTLHKKNSFVLRNNLSIHVTINTSRIFQVCYQSGWYGGGAHGTSSSTWQIFDRLTGNVIHVKDIINPDSLQAFEITVIKFVEDNMPTISKYGNEYIKPDQYVLEQKGIRLAYYTYTLGSYADGAKSLLLPIEQCSTYIKSEYKFW